ncbi:MAG: shikimate kinase [Clostridiales bacterium]|nr:shikimate kinase [Clostridiales bacterium]MDY5513799.1 shikimate kinase [Candidatus Ventricola sp.]
MRKPLFLVGMMGCGKSTMGRLLAGRLNAPFVDLDEEIVRFEGRSIPEIFADAGDAGFRVLETAALRRVCAGSPCVVATGGGIVTREENIALMREAGLVVFLCRPLEDIIAQVRQDTRPNLAGDKAERMHTLYAQREALYRRAAHLCFDNTPPAAQSARQLAAQPEIRALMAE